MLRDEDLNDSDFEMAIKSAENIFSNFSSIFLNSVHCVREISTSDFIRKDVASVWCTDC